MALLICLMYALYYMYQEYYRYIVLVLLQYGVLEWALGLLGLGVVEDEGYSPYRLR